MEEMDPDGIKGLRPAKLTTCQLSYNFSPCLHFSGREKTHITTEAIQGAQRFFSDSLQKEDPLAFYSVCLLPLYTS